MEPEVCEVFIFSPGQVEFQWPYLEEALDLDPSLWEWAYSKDNLKVNIAQRAVQVWGVSDEDCIFLSFMTRILRMGREGTLQIFWMQGRRMEEILPLLDETLDNFAAKYGCGRIEVCGRKGWERVLKPYRFKFESVVLSRTVEPRKGY